MLNKTIEIFKKETEKKTGNPKKPSKTGFAKYAKNRIKIGASVRKILNVIESEIDPLEEHVGSLGEKGDLYCRTNLQIQDGSFSNPDYSPLQDINKTPQKEFSKKVKSIYKNVFSSDLFNNISTLNNIDDISLINTTHDLLLFDRHFVLNNEVYNPSEGESAMLLLHVELQEDKEIYLIDEPEKSLGNDYINNTIVPILKKKAKLGKRVVIATHDANIAVRTLPYKSIYRAHDNGKYYTMVGNPFTNKLKCKDGDREELDWKAKSMETLEGGEEAFGERGKIYGK